MHDFAIEPRDTSGEVPNKISEKKGNKLEEFLNKHIEEFPWQIFWTSF